MRRQSLSRRLDANRIRQWELDRHHVTAWFLHSEPEELQLARAVNLIRCVDAPGQVDGEIYRDVCKLINRALLFKEERLFVSVRERTHLPAIGWIPLATDLAFLNGLVQLMCSGLGVPGNQQPGAMLLCNLCTIVATDLKNIVNQERVAALRHLVHHVVGPLLIVINCPQLTLLIPYAAQALRNLISASQTGEFRGWFKSTLLIPHVIKALNATLPPAIQRPCSTFHEVSMHAERLRRVIAEEELDLTVLSSLIELLPPCIEILYTSDDISLRDDELARLSELLRVGLVNILCAFGSYWPCETCRSKGFDWSETSCSSIAGWSCETLWDELDEETMYAIETILRCAFLITGISTYTCQQFFLNHDLLAEVSIHLAWTITQCRATTLAWLTDKCVLYALRLIGQIWCLPNPNRTISPLDHDLMRTLYQLSLWLTYHMDWSLCAAEVCSTLANAQAYLPTSAGILWQNVNDSLCSSLLVRCILPGLSSTLACTEALRFILNLLVCWDPPSMPLVNFCTHSSGLALLHRLERFMRELSDLRSCLPESNSQPEWMLSCSGLLIDICQVFTNWIDSVEQLSTCFASNYPNLYRWCLQLGRLSSQERVTVAEHFPTSSLRDC